MDLDEHFEQERILYPKVKNALMSVFLHFYLDLIVKNGMFPGRMHLVHHQVPWKIASENRSFRVVCYG